jgi:3-carboxy-cis,cis-muconate cycloisomerase
MAEGFAHALFGDDELARLFTEAAEVNAIVAVEMALARVQARLFVVPAAAAAAIERSPPVIDHAAVRAGMAASGVPTIALLTEYRKALPADAASALHFGATSQDVMDTGLVLRLRDALDILDQRLKDVIAALAGLAQRHRATVMLARTRWQQALPTTFGARVANWLAPLIRHRQRLAELRPRVLCVQLGGAAGTLSAMGTDGVRVMEALAHELALTTPPTPWHVQRDGVIEAGQWLALVAGSLGKMGLDVALLAQSEIAEVAESGGRGRGGSSTLPQKVNPVVSDVMVSIARQVAAHAGTLHQAALAEHERGASAWQLEWLNVPPMVELTGAALRHAMFLARNLVVETGRMTANLEGANGLYLAEAATFALAEHMNRSDAQRLVKEAVEQSRAEGKNLIDCLAACTMAPVDWNRLRDPRNHCGAVSEFIDRTLAGIG